MLALNTLEQYLQQYLRKLGNGVKFWWWEFNSLVISPGGGYESVPFIVFPYMFRRCLMQTYDFVNKTFDLWIKSILQKG